jgi:hypothetical protein
MKEITKDPAAVRIREQVRKLEAELRAVLHERDRACSLVEASRQETLHRLEEVAELAAREGVLRIELAELDTALKGLQH